MFWIYEGIAKLDIEFVITYIMQEHIDTAKVVSCDVDFLSVESQTNIITTQDFCKLQKKRT